jgi:hypothetical protein
MIDSWVSNLTQGAPDLVTAPDQQRTTPRRAARCAASGERSDIDTVMAGLDPAIHPLHKTLFRKTLSKRMDCRVKPGNDERRGQGLSRSSPRDGRAIPRDDRGERPARREALKVCALATGLGDKAVSLVYERLLHQEKSQVWMQRCETQIAGVLDALEAGRAGRSSAFWFGDAIGHADIAVACVVRFTREAHPAVFDARRWPGLAAHAERCEALPPFQEIAQPFSAPGE